VVRIGTVWGMPVHVSWPLGAALVLLAIALVRVRSLAFIALLVVGIIVSVLAHELAHGVAARRHGFDVERVVVTLLGSHTVWSGERDPEAHTAIAIAAAGPAVSALLATVSVLAGWDALAFANLAIAVVNLVPITGTDGWVIWKAATTSSTTPEP
jgi:Zn-dependent protease